MHHIASKLLVTLIAFGLVASAPVPASASTSGIALGVWNNSKLVSGTWLQKHQQSEAQFGTYEGHWRQFKPEDKNGQLSTDEETVLAAGKRLFVNWKPQGVGGT